MSLLHMDGFDRYQDRADLFDAGYGGSDNNFHMNMLPSGGRFGGGAVGVESVDDNVKFSLGVDASALLIVGVSFFVDDAASSDYEPILSFRDGSSVLHRIDAQYDAGRLTAVADGSEVGDATGLYSQGAWHRLEVLVEIAASGGRFIVEVDQGRVIDFTGDTTAAGGSTIDNFFFSSTDHGFQIRYDDLVVMDDAGAQLNDLIGDTRIYTQAPDSDVAAGWTPSGGGSNFADVDEIPNDGDTSYVEASAADVRDEYGVTDLPGDVSVVHAVKAAAWARKTDANNRSLEVGVGSGAQEDLSAGQPLSSDFSSADHIVEVDPDGGGAWSPSAVNGLTVIQETA